MNEKGERERFKGAAAIAPVLGLRAAAMYLPD
jgi:hypothetical protein